MMKSMLLPPVKLSAVRAGAAVVGHALGQFFCGLEVVEFVNRAGLLGFLIADANEPNGVLAARATFAGFAGCALISLIVPVK